MKNVQKVIKISFSHIRSTFSQHLLTKFVICGLGGPFFHIISVASKAIFSPEDISATKSRKHMVDGAFES